MAQEVAKRELSTASRKDYVWVVAVLFVVVQVNAHELRGKQLSEGNWVLQSHKNDMRVVEPALGLLGQFVRLVT